MSAPCDLTGIGVLVTRPAAQAAALCQRIETAGGRPVAFPTLDIVPVEDPGPAQRALAQRWDLLIFVSPNAVERALPLCRDGRLPPDPPLAAVGAATARALAAAGRAPDLVPSGRYDTEALLALPALVDLRGRRVLIVRGEGGRALLGDSLIARGAELAYAEVYRRTLPDADPTDLLTRWQREVHVVTATSGKVLENLLALLGPSEHERAFATPLVVLSERTRETALQTGFRRVEVAARADDEALLVAICRATDRIA